MFIFIYNRVIEIVDGILLQMVNYKCSVCGSFGSNIWSDLDW